MDVLGIESSRCKGPFQGDVQRLQNTAWLKAAVAIDPKVRNGMLEKKTTQF
jgi:hypothetical protein